MSQAGAQAQSRIGSSPETDETRDTPESARGASLETGRVTPMMAQFLAIKEAHPGSLLWLADWDGVPIIGMPTCGLFAQATVFDLVISRILTGERIGRRELGRLAQGGFLTRDMSFRLPAYRSATERGAVE